MSKIIQAAIFDLDGTLQDSEILWVAATRNYLASLGSEISYAEAEAIVYGRGWREIFAAMRRLAPNLADTPSQTAADDVREFYLELRDHTSIAIESSLNLLKNLAATMPVAVVSGAPSHDVAESVAHLGIESLLALHYGADDYPAGKPSPAGFLQAAQTLSINPANCIVFEDANVGVRAAKAAGMHCVALARPGRPHQDLSLADLIVEDLALFSLDSFESNLKGA